MPGVVPMKLRYTNAEMIWIKLPDEVMNCDQINGFNESHLHQVDDFGEEIFKCCLSACNTLTVEMDKYLKYT